MKKKTKESKGLAKRLLPLIILSIILYTVAAFSLQFYNGTEISPTLTTAYFAFWSVEIVNLAAIKKSKIKNSYVPGNDAEEAN